VTVDQTRSSVRRILIALDASHDSQAALEAALEMAVRLESELVGLYVEDVNLLRAAEHPLMQEICGVSGRTRRFDLHAVESQFRAQAVVLRQMLRRAAEGRSVRWKFEVRRGAVPGTLLAASADADLIVLGRSGRSAVASKRVGSACRLLLTDAPALTMVVARGERLGYPIVVVHDGTERGRRALALTRRLRADSHGRVTVVLMPDGDEDAAELRREARKLLGNGGPTAVYLNLRPGTASRLAQVVATARGGILIAPAPSSVLEGQALLELLFAIDSPVLLVR
jgi:nucleotide-binding universal stress UspA family protein